jgi:hypothetical protein
MSNANGAPEQYGHCMTKQSDYYLFGFLLSLSEFFYCRYQLVVNSIIPNAVAVPNKIPRSAPLEPTLPKRHLSRPTSSLSKSSRAGSATRGYPVNYRVSQSNGGTYSNVITKDVKSLFPKLSSPNTTASYSSLSGATAAGQHVKHLPKY